MSIASVSEFKLYEPTGMSGGSSDNTIAYEGTRTVRDILRSEVVTWGAMRNFLTSTVDDLIETRNAVDHVHLHALENEVDDLTDQHSQRTLKSLLNEIGMLGFSWHDVASIARVKVSTIRQWRRDETSITNTDRSIARLVALCGVIRDHYLIDDIAGWFETPLSSETSVSALNMLIDGRLDLVFRLARDRETSVVEILDEFDPDWRVRADCGVEVFTAPDGHLGIRLK